MFEYLKALSLRPRCPKCGKRHMKPIPRTPPYAAGKGPGYKYECKNCGAVIDPPIQLLMRLCQ